MKLTTKQVDAVFDYVASHDIKWYELQIELTDHLVSIMEEMWSADSELSFQQVKYQAEQRFGRNYFKEIEEERRKILKKQFNRNQYKMVSEYLKFPKIALSILMVFVVYRISFYFEDISFYIKILYGILFSASVFTMLNWYRYRKINGKNFLSLETVLRVNNKAISFSFFAVLGVNSFKETFPENYIFYIPFYFLWVLGILLIITGYQITNKVASRIKKQYQLI
ncbi:MAG: hypothetical protein ACI976_002920 [Aureispira sp.]|jgi:hypothetical protein